MIAVYIISTVRGTFYTGMTNSIVRRWGEHVRGESIYLSVVHPIEVVYIEFWHTYSVASKRERYIKRVGAKKFLLKLKYGKSHLSM